MSVKSTSSIPGHESVVRTAYLKKLKTSKKKFFVLRAEAPESSARLEYYDSEKKFNNGQAPKRSIPLKTCFNINKRVDTKYKHVIALYTKVDCFCIVLENEEELDAWLKDLLSLQHGEEAVDGEIPRPTFEHVWQVTILNRGLGGNSVLGAYNKGTEAPTFRLCLTDKTLSLIRQDKNTPQAELSLTSIRSCGSLKNYVYLEVGRSSVTGSGELWMETEDGNIAQNVHETIFHAMSTSSSSKEELAPKSRYRSSSATEASKPSGRKQTYSGSTKHYSQDVNPQIVESPVPVSTSSTHIAGASSGTRERCDSMPSRARTSSEGTHPIHTWIQARSHLSAHRPQSLYVRDISHSPPVESPISPPSGACSTDSAGSSLSIDDPDQWCETDTILSRYSHSLTPDEAIAEENYDECPDSPCLQQGSSPSGYIPVAPISSDDGYVDMSPRGQHAAMSPAASFSSVTSGTPSTDMRFIDYPLEKVSAYFTPSEEDTAMSDRPIRAYSVGSRPDGISNKTKLDMASTLENVRVRAFSVGSKSRKILTRVLPPHGSLIHPRPKSSSAPVLTGSRTLLSQNSDLMEMDFSKPSPSTSGYVDITPKGYMEMRPGLPIGSLIQSTPPDYPPIHSGPKVVTAKPPQQEYIDMTSSKIYKVVGSSPKYPSIDSAIEVSSDYMDMDYQQSPKPTTSDSNLNKFSRPSTSDSNFNKFSRPSTSDSYFHQSPKSSATEGYVEMSLGRSSHQRQSSLDNDDYTDMSGSKKTNRKDTRSQPITIHTSLTTTTSTTQFPKGSSSISPVYSSLHVGRKYSAGTYMPISSSNNANTFSSLPRQRSRKNSRNDSRDSSSSSTTTPSSSSMQFPLSLNSPTSPLKPQSSKPPESQPTGTIKVPQAVMNVKYNRSGNDYTSMDCKSRDYVNYTPSPLRSSTESSNFADYTSMKSKLESTKAKQENEADYVFTRPRHDSGDYAIIRPGSDFSDHIIVQPRVNPSEHVIIKHRNSGEHVVTQSRTNFDEHAIIQPKTNTSEHVVTQIRTNSGEHALIQSSRSHSDEYARIQPKAPSSDYVVTQTQTNSGEHVPIQSRTNSAEHAPIQSRSHSGKHAIIQPKTNSSDYVVTQTQTNSGEYVPIQSRTKSDEHALIQSRTNSGKHAIIQPKANSSDYVVTQTQTNSGEHALIQSRTKSDEHVLIQSRTNSGEHAIIQPKTNSSDYVVTQTQTTSGEHVPIQPRTNFEEHALIQSRTNSGEHASIQSQTHSDKHAIIQLKTNSSENLVTQSQTNSGEHVLIQSRTNSGEYAPIQSHPGEHTILQPQANSSEHPVIQPHSNSGEYAVLQSQAGSIEHALIQPRTNSGEHGIIQSWVNYSEHAVIQPHEDSGEYAVLQSRTDTSEHALIKPRTGSGEHDIIPSCLCNEHLIFPHWVNSGEHTINQSHADSDDYTVMHPSTSSGDFTVRHPVTDAGDYTVMRPRTDSGDYAIMRPGIISGDYTHTQPQQSGGDYAVMRPGSLDISRNMTEPFSSSTLSTQLSSMALSRIGGELSAARCFIPISESQDATMSPWPGDLASNRPQEDSAYEYMSPIAKISRPNSANSEKRPNSTSSELGSSSSTLVGSRPGSVTSDSIRPASVNIEGQLHYASLDLAPTTEEDCNRSPRTSKPDINSSTSPTPNVPENGASGFTYAEIDFIKSDGFKQAMSNAKVKN